jgi:hypothetical protein
MTRDPLREALRSLPRERAGADFTSRGPGLFRGRPAWRAVAAAATLAGLLAAAGGVTLSRFGRPPDAAPPAGRRARLERLQAERARLAAELQDLKQMADTTDPVIYLGGDDRVDLVLDVGRLARDQRDRRAGRIEPATYHRPDTP